MRGVRFFSLLAVSVFAAGVFAASDANAGADEGKKLFASKNCGSCHQIQGPANEKSIEDVLAKKGPELWFAGSKYQKAFLENWLQNPTPIRGMEYYTLTKKNEGKHAKLDAAGAKDVAEYLGTLKSADVKAAGITPKGSPQGRIIFEKKQGCYGCHEVKKGGNVVGGLTGPTMVGIGERLQPDFIYAWLSNPTAFKKIKDMPTYEGILSDAELKTLSEYVSSLK